MALLRINKLPEALETGVTIHVKTRPGGATATIYTDATLVTPTANPFAMSAAQVESLEIFAENGLYNLVIGGTASGPDMAWNGGAEYTVPFEMEDPNEIMADHLAAVQHGTTAQEQADIAAAANAPDASQAEAEAGTEAGIRRFSPLRIRQSIEARPIPLLTLTEAEVAALPDGIYLLAAVIPTPDTESPTIAVFEIEATASSLTVNITTWTGSDNVAVTGWLLSESAAHAGFVDPNDAAWAGTEPTTWTFSTDGSVTLYAAVKDAAGNISAQASDTCVITLPANAPPTFSAQPTESSVTSSSITLAYGTSDADGDSYLLESSTDDGATWQTEAASEAPGAGKTVVINTVSTDGTTALSASTAYTCRIRITALTGDTTPVTSNSVIATTAAGAAYAALDPAATGSSLTLSGNTVSATQAQWRSALLDTPCPADSVTYLEVAFANINNTSRFGGAGAADNTTSAIIETYMGADTADNSASHSLINGRYRLSTSTSFTDGYWDAKSGTGRMGILVDTTGRRFGAYKTGTGWVYSGAIPGTADLRAGVLAYGSTVEMTIYTNPADFTYPDGAPPVGAIDGLVAP